jgi:hypothetical protein
MLFATSLFWVAYARYRDRPVEAEAPPVHAFVV